MIVLKRLKLRNFLSHEDTEIDFPLGVTVIVGPNGAGKTAIMDAVIHAFLGFERDVKTRGENVDDLIRRGTNGAEISLLFEANNKEYLVRWIRTRGGRVEAFLQRKDLGYIARSAKQVRQEVLKLLELDSRTLLNSIFIRQGEVTNLVEVMPADRKKLIGRMIGLDAFEKVWEGMREIIDHVNVLKSNVEMEIRDKSARLDEKKRNYNECVRAIKELKEEMLALDGDVKQLEKKYELVSREKQSLDEKEQIFNVLQKDYDNVRRDLSDVENRLGEIARELEESMKAREEVRKLESEIKKIDLLENYVKIDRDIQEYDREERDLREKLMLLDEAENWIKDCLKKVVEFNYTSKIEVDSAKIDLPDEPIGLNTRAAKTVSDVEHLTEQLKTKEKELTALLKKVEGFLVKPTRQALNGKLAELEKKIREIDGSIKEKDGEIGWISSRIEKLTQDFNSLDKFDVCPLCRTRLTPQHREQAKLEIFEELNSLKKRHTYVVEERKKLEDLRENARIDYAELLKLSVDVENIERLSSDLEVSKKSLVEKTYELNAILSKVGILRKEVGGRLSKVEEALAQIQGEFDKLVVTLGYKPRKPEDELKALRIRKERYDRLKPIADRYEEKAEDFEKNTGKKLKLEEEEKRLRESISSLGYDPKRHEEIKKEFDLLRDKLVKGRTKLENLKTRLNDEERKIATSENEIRQLESDRSKLKAKCDKIEDFKSKLEKIREAFSRDGVQRMLRQRLTPYMSEFATRYVERFNLDITGIMVDEDLEVTVMKGGETAPLSLLSGGEKVAVAIALRLAIAKALAGTLSTIIMDEPTIHLDEERRKELVEVVKSFFREGAVVPQMVVITHDRELEEVADMLYQVEKINGISKIVG